MSKYDFVKSLNIKMLYYFGGKVYKNVKKCCQMLNGYFFRHLFYKLFGKGS